MTLARYGPRVSARAILLTGTVGSGKKSVAIEIGEFLERGDAPYALVDLDWLAWLRPAPASLVTPRSALAENLSLIWRTFRAAGVERLVLARFLEDRAQLDALRGALPGVELVVVRLVAPAGLVERRLHARDSGFQLTQHLAETAAFAVRGAQVALEDAVVANGERPLGDVAADVLSAAGWSI
jgi:adenylylsulfate kinase